MTDECTCGKCRGFTIGGVTRDDPADDHVKAYLSGNEPPRRCVCTFLSINHRMQACGRDPVLGWFCTQCGGTVAEEFAPMYCQCDRPIASVGGNVCLVCGKYFSAHNEAEQHKKNIEEQLQLDIEDIIADVQKRPTIKPASVINEGTLTDMSDNLLIAGMKTMVEHFNAMADELQTRGYRIHADVNPVTKAQIAVTIYKKM
jgi:hypothetical protein